MKWVFTTMALALLLSWEFRWSELEPVHPLDGAQVSYKKDIWTGQTWATYYPPLGVFSKSSNIDIPLFPSETRFNSSEEAVIELEKRGRSYQLVETWRKRDFATYIWANITVISIICSIIGFWRNKKRAIM